jgi:ketosteroid isomerase-like protein
MIGPKSSEEVQMEPREIVREALQGLDEPGGEGFLERLTEDAELVSPLAAVRGREAIREFVRGMHAAFSDWQHDVTIETVGNLVVAEGTWNGTHSGPMAGPQGEVQPTGKRASVPFAGIVRVRDGRIASVHNYFDQMTFMAQLGLMPEPAAAPA